MSLNKLWKSFRMSIFGKKLQFGLFWIFDAGPIDSGFRGSYEGCEEWAYAVKDYWRSQGATPTTEARIERQIKECQFLIVPVAS